MFIYAQRHNCNKFEIYIQDREGRKITENGLKDGKKGEYIIIYFMFLFKHDSTITRQIVNGNSIGN